MTDAELHKALADLGIDRDTWRAALLLPLVQVAWADGAVQPAERVHILEVADRSGLLETPAGEVLHRWLDHPPTPETLVLGRQVLTALVQRHRGPGAELDASDLRALEAQCHEVARAAGGLFDLMFTVDRRESEAIREIAAALHRVGDEALDDLPSPEGGRFTDL